MKAEVIMISETEADIYMSDGGVATLHHNGEGILTTYYQDRCLPEELNEDETIWDRVAEGKAYCKEWGGQHTITDEMIEDAVHWLAPMQEVYIRKINDYGKS